MAFLGTKLRHFFVFPLIPLLLAVVLAHAESKVELTDQEGLWLHEHPVWRAACLPFPPFSWQDSDGSWHGIHQDFSRMITSRLDVKIEPIAIPFESSEHLKNGLCDVSLLASHAPDAALSQEFSNEIVRIPVVVVTRSQSTDIESFEDLRGKTIAVVLGRPSHEKMADGALEVVLKPEKTTEEALSSVMQGNTDAFVCDLASASHVLAKDKYKDLKIATYAPYSVPFRVAVRQDWAPLVPILNKTIASFAPEERSAIRTKWMTPKVENLTARDIMRVALPVVVVLCILLLVASNWRLKNAVALRTEELREAMERVANQNAFLDSEVARRTREIETMKDATIIALAGLAETRDTDTGAHLRRTQLYVRTLAEAARGMPAYSGELTDEVINILSKTSPLHDIGKVGIPDSILLKPGKLTKEEFEIMKGHVTLGGKAIAAAEAQMGTTNSFMRYAREIVTSHHEKWDGSGYPKGLKGASIPLAGRIMAIADVYDALRTKRVYKDAISHEAAVQIIVEGRGTHFDPGLVDAFMEVHTRFNTICADLTDPA